MKQQDFLYSLEFHKENNQNLMKLKWEFKTEPNLTSYGLNQRSIKLKKLGIDPALVSADVLYHISLKQQYTCTNVYMFLTMLCLTQLTSLS